MIRRGDIYWASLPEPAGSGPGFRRPMLVVSDDAFNESRIQTVICAVVTSNLALAQAPGNVRVAARVSGLAKPSVINVSQLLSLDRRFLTERAGGLDARTLEEVDAGLRLVLGL